MRPQSPILTHDSPARRAASLVRFETRATPPSLRRHVFDSILISIELDLRPPRVGFRAGAAFGDLWRERKAPSPSATEYHVNKGILNKMLGD